MKNDRPMLYGLLRQLIRHHGAHGPDRWKLRQQPNSMTTRALPGPIVVCFGRFGLRGLPFPNARYLGHPFQWKNTLPWHPGLAAKVGILRFKNLPPFRHGLGFDNHV